jgi:uncharacterized metal-binding protein YceD (DUF177 family)
MPKARKSDTALWSVPVRIEDVPAPGAHLTLSADAGVRNAIAAATGLLALPRFDATFDVQRHGRGGARVTGSVSADVEQTCVVTLEPVRNSVDESVDLTLTPPSATPAELEAELPPEGDDPPDPLTDGALDLGAIAVEFLLLGVDPYPRKADAVFVAPSDGDNGDQAAHPFAALAALKKGEPEAD